MPVTGNIFFSFIVCEHNAQHMIIGHIKIIPLPHLCQRFHFSRAPKAVSSPVEKLSHSLLRLALKQTSCNRIRWCSLSFKSCWSSDQHWLEICFEVKFSFSKLKKKTLIMIYSWAGFKIEPGSDVWVATPKWCLRPHWTAHHHQPSNSFLIQMYKKFKIDAKLLTMLKRRMPKPHTVRGSALAIQFQAKKERIFLFEIGLGRGCVLPHTCIFG